jgi:hypothetical protein
LFERLVRIQNLGLTFNVLLIWLAFVFGISISANKFIWDGDKQNPLSIVFFSSSKMILNYSSTLTQGGVTYNYTLKRTYTKL